MTGQAKPAPVARVGRYEMGAEIASGGMATVYLARMSGAGGFEKLVALKRVHPHLASEPAFVDMFLDEARIASRIQHPNVCQVFDFGEANGDYFIAMEFLVGETLAKLQRSVAKSDYLNDPRRTFVCARLIADACEGLHAAHELKARDGSSLNVVHRDISPQNLFVTFDGHVKVVDFGIASASDRLHQTSTGTVKGKFAYMAPEQARGHKVDRRADVFSLGVVLWELLAFQRLFRRDTPAETLVALMSDPIQPPSERSPLAPPELDAVVLKALERNPEDRYENARELGRDLMRTLGRLGDAVDRAEVSEWLEGLFPDGVRRHEILLENAKWGDAERTERSDPGAVSEVISRSSWSGVKAEEFVDPADVEQIGVEPVEPNEPSPGFAPIAGGLPASGAPAFHGTPSTALLEGNPGQATNPSLTPPPLGSSHLTAVPSRAPVLRWVALAAVALLVTAATAVGLTLLIDRSDPTTVAATEPATRVAGPADDAPAAQGAVGVAGGSPNETSATAAVVGDGEGTDEGEAQDEGDATDEGGTADAEDADDAEDDPGVTEGDDDDGANRQSADARRRAVRRARRDQRRARQAHAGATTTATGPGTVIVSTPGGWANVYDRNGRFLGETPLTLSLPAGRHRLSLRPFGQPPSRNATVEVQAGETSRVNQPL